MEWSAIAPHELGGLGGGRQSVSLQKLCHLHVVTFPDVKCKKVEKRLKFCKSELFVNLFLYQSRPVKEKVNSVRKEHNNMIKTQTMKMLCCKLIINYNQLKINCFLFAMFSLIF